MTISLEDVVALEALDEKFRAILPPLYSDSYDAVSPSPMGSAPLKYDVDGRVAWDRIWGSFCDLAMAGGPPHRGNLLEPASEAEIADDPENYDRIVEEICRGVSMVTGLPATRSSAPGWIALECKSIGMAAWLARAIVMENVMARHAQQTLFLPAGPQFRLQKEVKNVVTVIAKTCHYWLQHTPEDQQRSISAMFSNTPIGVELLEPASTAEVFAEPGAYREVVERMRQEISSVLNLTCFTGRYAGWMAVECPSVRKAVWMIRAMIVENVLARRERELVFLPASPKFATGGQCERIVRMFTYAYHLSVVGKIC
jgi:sirohydrochlorin cobaltochelatase